MRRLVSTLLGPEMRTPPKVLIVDNYDSYTYNLAELIGVALRASSRARSRLDPDTNTVANPDAWWPDVVRNDERSADQLLAEGYTHIVISPGPGHPSCPDDFGVCSDLIEKATVPVLGVCLGHQGLATTFGGTVAAIGPVHGRVAQIRHNGNSLFEGVPQTFAAVRYHSLAITEVPENFEVTATADDGTVMGVRHRVKQLSGLQFHPESILSEYGHVILSNFLGLPRVSGGGAVGDGSRSAGMPDSRVPTRLGRPVLRYRKVSIRVNAEEVFRRLSPDASRMVWLDSACDPGWTGRFSYLAVADELDMSVTYQVASRTVTEHVGSSTRTIDGVTIFDYLDANTDNSAEVDLPFEFDGGWVGYVGYECKADTGGEETYSAATPDACVLRVRRFFVFDHRTAEVYVASDDHDAEERLDDLESVLTQRTSTSGEGNVSGIATLQSAAVVETWSRERYDSAFESVQRALHAGDSYEVNLTYQTKIDSVRRPEDVYCELRRINPAPYSAFLRHHDTAVVSASPERFLTIDRERRIEVRPMKGTLPRGETMDEDSRLRWKLATGPRFHSENLMIVDLMRNDLSKVCMPGSVAVTALMGIEDYPSVFQMVTTIEGALSPQMTPVRATKAMFPPGSMTGAPKIRTMELIDTIEKEARGVYSGVLGWWSNAGQADLSVVIRTLVWKPGTFTYGAGGGITVQSQADEEFAETELKAERLLRALDIDPAYSNSNRSNPERKTG